LVNHVNRVAGKGSRFARKLTPPKFILSNEINALGMRMVTEDRVNETGLVTEGRAVEVGRDCGKGSLTEYRVFEVGIITEGRAVETHPITEFRSAKVGNVPEARTAEVGGVINPFVSS
jgi:hypothetical protein